MIVEHQDNTAAFAGAHTVYWVAQPAAMRRISVTSAAAANELIEQARSIARFVQGRVFGRVN